MSEIQAIIRLKLPFSRGVLKRAVAVNWIWWAKRKENTGDGQRKLVLQVLVSLWGQRNEDRCL